MSVAPDEPSWDLGHDDRVLLTVAEVDMVAEREPVVGHDIWIAATHWSRPADPYDHAWDRDVAAVAQAALDWVQNNRT